MKVVLSATYLPKNVYPSNYRSDIHSTPTAHSHRNLDRFNDTIMYLFN
jgi:hypothetical protein